MNRLFDNHKIRKQVELSGLWEFQPANDIKDIPQQFQYQLPVPGCWEQHPSFTKYRGFGYYRKKVTLDQGCNIRFEFKGVSHTADVFWDGVPVGHHYNAYTPFSVIIPHATPGQHEIMVRVDNSYSDASALHIPNDYYTYGGITRAVLIEEINDVYIERLEFTPNRSNEGQWTARIRAFIRNAGSEVKQISAVSKIDGKAYPLGAVTLCDNEATILEKDFSFPSIKSWSYNDPKLYLLETVIHDDDLHQAVDDFIDRVGFRTIEVKGKDILLNGEPIYIKGFNRHEDHPMVGCAIPFQLMLKDLHLMQDLGCNAVRTSHYPNDELFLDLCDEFGFLVWEESHARGLSLNQMKNPNFDKQSEDCIREMIENHYNHPSIIIWGILNECASDTEEGREIYRKQFSQIRSLDMSRPLTTACCKHFNELCYDLCDIVSMNIYSGWYIDDPVNELYEKLIEHVEKTGGENKPVIISEFGGGAVYGFRDPAHEKWSEERQSDILENNIEYYTSRSEIKGLFIWQFCDGRVSSECFYGRPKTRNNKGVVDEYRRPKLSYETVKRHFHLLSSKQGRTY